MPRVRLYVAVVGESVFVETPSSLAVMGFAEKDLAEGFGDAGRWHEIEVKTPTFGMQEEAKRKSLIPDPQVGFRIDQGLLMQARAEVFLAEWPDWQWKSFEELPPNVANVLDAELQALLYPATATHPDFFAVLRRKLQSSQAENKQPEQTPTSPE